MTFQRTNLKFLVSWGLVAQFWRRPHKAVALCLPPIDNYQLIRSFATMGPIRNLILVSIVLSQLFLGGAANKQTESSEVTDNEKRDEGEIKNKLRGLNRNTGRNGRNGQNNRGGRRNGQGGGGRGGNRNGGHNGNSRGSNRHSYQDPYMMDPYYYK